MSLSNKSICEERGAVNAIGTVISYFGGWIGGGLAGWRAPAPDLRDARSEEPPPAQ
jgi:hypothetical protein